MPKRQASKAVKSTEEEQSNEGEVEKKSLRKGRKGKESNVEAEKPKTTDENPVDAAEETKDADEKPEKKQPAKRGRKPKEVKEDAKKPKVAEEDGEEDVKNGEKAPEVKKPVAKGRKAKEDSSAVAKEDDEEDVKNGEEAPEVKKPVAKGRKAKEDSSADAEEAKNPEKKQPAKRGRKPKETATKSKLAEEQKEKEEEEEDEIENGEELEEVKKPAAAKGRKAKQPTVVEDSDEKSEKKQPAKRGRKPKETKEDAKKLKLAEEANEEEMKNGEEAPEVKKPVAKGRKAKEPAVKPKPAAATDDDDDDDEKEDKEETKNGGKDTDEPEEKQQPAKRGRKPKEPKEEPTEPEKDVKNKATTDLESINFTCEKKNKKGNEPNLKICSWNVGGARAVVKKQGYEYILKEDADIVLLQETKCTNEQLTEVLSLPGYKMFSQDADGGKPGYCGVALFTKKDPINVTYGLAGSNCATESRMITAEYDDYFIVCSYHPNAGRKLVTIDKKLEWNKIFKDYVKDLDSKKPVIICGDLNVAHQAIDLKNPGTNEKTAGYTKEERDAMTELIEAGFVDTYRKLYPDTTGAYTFWSYLGGARARNTGWRLDYFLTSERVVDNICDNVIRSDVFGSDHCPIVLFAHF